MYYVCAHSLFAITREDIYISADIYVDTIPFHMIPHELMYMYVHSCPIVWDVYSSRENLYQHCFVRHASSFTKLYVMLD